MENLETRVYPDGAKKEEWFDSNGESHRENGPSCIVYYPTGEVEFESYYIHGLLWRLDGPAIVEYEKDGTVIGERWYEKDLRLFKEDFCTIEEINQLKAWSLFTPIELVKMRLDK